MAVEAQYLHLFSPQSQLYRNREKMDPNSNQMVATAPVFVPTIENNFVNNSNINHNNNFSNISNISKKRSRDSLYFLGEDVSPHVYNHMYDLDRLILQHVANARIELLEKRKRVSNQMMAVINETVSRRMKSKDEEIEQLRKVNYALEERINSLGTENNVWKYLAQTNEAAASTLRANLEQVLASQVRVKEECEFADDAESCCYGDNCSPLGMRRMCVNCGIGEPSVLLLPCRHLCLCVMCGPGVDTCPICKSNKTGSINVNLSS